VNISFILVLLNLNKENNFLFMQGHRCDKMSKNFIKLIPKVKFKLNSIYSPLQPIKNFPKIFFKNATSFTFFALFFWQTWKIQ